MPRQGEVQANRQVQQGRNGGGGGLGGSPSLSVVSRPMDTYSGPGKTIIVPEGQNLQRIDRAGAIMEGAGREAQSLMAALNSFNGAFSSYAQGNKIQNEQDKKKGYSDAVKGVDAPDGASYGYMAGRSLYSGEADAIKYGQEVKDFIQKNGKTLPKEELLKGIEDLQKAYLTEGKDEFYTMGFHERAVAYKVNGAEAINKAIIERDKERNIGALSTGFMDDVNNVLAKGMKPEALSRNLRDLISAYQVKGAAVDLGKSEVSAFAVDALVSMAKERKDLALLRVGQEADADGVKLEALHPKVFSAARQHIKDQLEQDRRQAEADARRASEEFQSKFMVSIFAQAQRKAGEAPQEHAKRVADLKENLRKAGEDGVLELPSGKKVSFNLGPYMSVMGSIDRLSDPSVYGSSSDPDAFNTLQTLARNNDPQFFETFKRQTHLLKESDGTSLMKEYAESRERLQDSRYSSAMKTASGIIDTAFKKGIANMAAMEVDPSGQEEKATMAKNLVGDKLREFYTANRANPEFSIPATEVHKIVREAMQETAEYYKLANEFNGGNGQAPTTGGGGKKSASGAKKPGVPNVSSGNVSNTIDAELEELIKASRGKE